MTRGERIIRPDFAKNEDVRETKVIYTLMMDKLETLMRDNFQNGEVDHDKFEIQRCAAEAQRHLELASMLHVKALTVK